MRGRPLLLLPIAVGGHYAVTTHGDLSFGYIRARRTAPLPDDLRYAAGLDRAAGGGRGAADQCGGPAHREQPLRDRTTPSPEPLSESCGHCRAACSCDPCHDSRSAAARDQAATRKIHAVGDRGLTVTPLHSRRAGGRVR